jgi:ribonuclease HII
MEDLDYLKTQDTFIAGTDEVGRGPLAGPVVGCCFFLSDVTEKKINRLINFAKEWGVTDSKKLTQVKRLKVITALGLDLEKLVSSQKLNISLSGIEGLSFSLTEISNTKIDDINILQASLLAMSESFKNCCVDLSKNYGEVLIDGNKHLKIDKKNIRETALIKGDSRSVLIGLSSIVAKEFRDTLMKNFGRKYPGYGLEQHAGYPTKAHKDAITKMGPTPIHRRTFKGVKEYLI